MLCKEQPKDRIQLFCLSFGKRQKEELENVEKKNNIRAEGGQSIVWQSRQVIKWIKWNVKKPTLVSIDLNVSYVSFSWLLWPA